MCARRKGLQGRKREPREPRELANTKDLGLLGWGEHLLRRGLGALDRRDGRHRRRGRRGLGHIEADLCRCRLLLSAPLQPPLLVPLINVIGEAGEKHNRYEDQRNQRSR